MPTQPKIIYDSEHIRVLHQPGASPFGLITFSHATQFVNGLWFWGNGVVNKANLEAVGVVARSGNWFPLDDMRQAAAAIRNALSHHRHVIGFGTSMGGYGALKHGRLLGMTHALAFVPQWSIDPADVEPWDRRFVRHFNPAVHHAVAIAPGDVAPMAAVFHDPFMKLDRLNFERILSANPQCTAIKSYFTAHSSIVTFKGTKPILGLFKLLLDGDFAAIQIRATEARRDSHSEVRPLALAQMMVDRDIDRAVRISEIHADKLTTRQKAALRHEIACALYVKGAFEQARQHSLRATELYVDRDFLTRLGMIEQKLGHLESALSIARDVCDRWPSNAGAHLKLSALLLELEKKTEALAVARKALYLAPSSVVALELLASMAQDQEQLNFVLELCRVRPDFRSQMMLGHALDKLQRVDEAITAFETAAALEPTRTSPHIKIAHLHIRTMNWAAAAGVARTAVALEPANSACHIVLAQALSGLECLDEALREA